ncbi:hypothetical protein ACR6C2_21765 [Streptomyces sp. INA 01156]
MESNVQARMKLRELVSYYVSRGYSVVPVKDLPEGIAALQPDLVVSKGDENIVIELKGGTQPSGSTHAVQLERMAEVLDLAVGSWSFIGLELPLPSGFHGIRLPTSSPGHWRSDKSMPQQPCCLHGPQLRSHWTE